MIINKDDILKLKDRGDLLFRVIKLNKVPSSIIITEQRFTTITVCLPRGKWFDVRPDQVLENISNIHSMAA